MSPKRKPPTPSEDSGTPTPSAEEESQTTSIGPQAAALEALGEVESEAGDTGDETPPSPDLEWKPLLAAAFRVSLSFAGRLDPVWTTDEDEVELLAGAWAPVCEKWSPGVSVEVVAVAVTVAWALPRAAMIASRPKARAPGRRQPDRGETIYEAPDDDLVEDDELADDPYNPQPVG